VHTDSASFSFYRQQIVEILKKDADSIA